jgi:hypothetical protein
MSIIYLSSIRTADNLSEHIAQLKEQVDERLNLTQYTAGVRPVSVSNNMVQRLALMAGLSLTDERRLPDIEALKLISSGNHIHDTTFSRNNLQNLWSALLKLRYQHLKVDWTSVTLKSKIVNYEMLRGCAYLLTGGRLDEYLRQHPGAGMVGASGSVPRLNVLLGSYEDDIPARLDLNGRNVANTQILIAGTTGQGKSNLLAVLINELRQASVESAYPVNFLFFDYKGEFSDPANWHWLSQFEVDGTALLNPLERPLPFSPFKDFAGRTQNEINNYATELANALCAIDRANISARMSERLTTAVIDAYRQTHSRPVDFERILHAYATQQPNKEDSITAVLKQLIRGNLFAKDDSVDLIQESYFINLAGFPKDGPLAKAIVYFVVSKLNTLYEKLPKQAVLDECVELRHFTIIDEAHYMLDFDNRPLRELIAVGRNKGLSIILATQSMNSYKSEHFDFLANAQYPLIMKQQTLSDSVIKDLFSVTGRSEFQEIKEAIGNLQKGEVILKDNTAHALGLGRRFKKFTVRRMI